MIIQKNYEDFECLSEPLAASIISMLATSRGGVHVQDLARKTGLDRRSLRKAIERIRRDGLVVCANQRGYFLPETVEEIESYVRQEKARARAVFFTLQGANALLRQLQEHG